MSTQQFIIDTLKGYIEDPKTCGYSELKGKCVYFDHDTKKVCAFGKHMKNPKDFENNGGSASYLLASYGEEILKEESRGKLIPDHWNSVQQIHDTIAEFKIKEAVMRLEALEKEAHVDLTELKDELKKGF